MAVFILASQAKKDARSQVPHFFGSNLEVTNLSISPTFKTRPSSARQKFFPRYKGTKEAKNMGRQPRGQTAFN